LRTLSGPCFSGFSHVTPVRPAGPLVDRHSSSDRQDACPAPPGFRPHLALLPCIHMVSHWPCCPFPALPIPTLGANALAPCRDKGPGPDRGSGPDRVPGPDRAPGTDKDPGPNKDPGPDKDPGPNRAPGPDKDPCPDCQSVSQAWHSVCSAANHGTHRTQHARQVCCLWKVMIVCYPGTPATTTTTTTLAPATRMPGKSTAVKGYDSMLPRHAGPSPGAPGCPPHRRLHQWSLC
jgi:hypothetical protein